MFPWGFGDLTTLNPFLAWKLPFVSVSFMRKWINSIYSQFQQTKTMKVIWNVDHFIGTCAAHKVQLRTKKNTWFQMDNLVLRPTKNHGEKKRERNIDPKHKRTIHSAHKWKCGFMKEDCMKMSNRLECTATVISN